MVSVATERPLERVEVLVIGSTAAGVASARASNCCQSYSSCPVAIASMLNKHISANWRKGNAGPRGKR